MSHANLVYKGLNQAFKTHNYNIWVISLSEHLTATFFFFYVSTRRNMIYCWQWSKYVKTCGHTLPGSSSLTQWLCHHLIQKPVSHNLSLIFPTGEQIRSPTQPFFKKTTSLKKIKSAKPTVGDTKAVMGAAKLQKLDSKSSSENT